MTGSWRKLMPDGHQGHAAKESHVCQATPYAPPRASSPNAHRRFLPEAISAMSPDTLHKGATSKPGQSLLLPKSRKQRTDLPWLLRFSWGVGRSERLFRACSASRKLHKNYKETKRLDHSTDGVRLP